MKRLIYILSFSCAILAPGLLLAAPPDPTLFSVTHENVVIQDGDQVFPEQFGTNPIIAHDMIFSFYWPNSVPNWRALVMLFRGTFGHLEGGAPQQDINYTEQVQTWPAGFAGVDKDMGLIADLGNLHASNTPSVYTALVADTGAYDGDPFNPNPAGLPRPEVAIANAIAWFASGGSEGVAPLGGYAMLSFTYATVTPSITDALALATSTEPTFAGEGVTPQKGEANQTIYTFKVIYTDAANHAPDAVSVVIGTTTLSMTLDATSTDAMLHDGNYANGEQYIATSTFSNSVSGYDYYFQAEQGSTTVRFPQSSTLHFDAGYDNVVFLPGIEASRLYDGSGKQLWEPQFFSGVPAFSDIPDLYLSDTAESIHPDIVTRDIIDEANTGDLNNTPFGLLAPNIYKTFEQSLGTLIAQNVIKQWEPLPYDWRLDIDTLVSRGVKNADGTISYTQPLTPNQEPYLISEIERMASTSPTGKVTIIAHSNGGLLAKVLTSRLQDKSEGGLIDKMIMVAVPQLGAPAAIAGLLHGDGQQIPEKLGFTFSRSQARTLGENSVGAYTLLPFSGYFDKVIDPVIVLDSTASTAPYRNAYGTSTIASFPLMDRFIGPSNGVRSEPADADTDTPNVLDQALLDRSNSIQQELANWQPPAGVQVIQIAGWGFDTIKGIEYKDSDRQPLFTLDGDGTVPVPSAVASSTEQTYYINLQDNNSGLRKNRSHADILEVSSVQELIADLIQGNVFLFPNNISIGEPTPTDANRRLRLSVHSPVSLSITDDTGLYTGLSTTTVNGVQAVIEQIPNSYYMEFGEGKYLGVDTQEVHTVQLHGLDTGTFTLDIDQVNGDGSIATSTVFKDVPVTASTTGTMIIQALTASTTLALDLDGDGTVDTTISAAMGATPQDKLDLIKKMVNGMQISKVLKTLLIVDFTTAEKLLDNDQGRNKNTAVRELLKATDIALKLAPAKAISSSDAQQLRIIIEEIIVELV